MMLAQEIHTNKDPRSLPSMPRNPNFHLANNNFGLPQHIQHSENLDLRHRRRVTSSDTSDEHSSDELLITGVMMPRATTEEDAKTSSSTSSDSCRSSHRSHQIDAMNDHHAVGQWLQFLQMDQYLQGFIDNGYDDFETVKQIGPPDLEAIGVSNPHHQAFLQDAVRVLREQGAVWVYLLQEDPELCSDQFPDRISAGGSSGIASGNSSSIPWTLSSSEAEHDQEYGATSSSGTENSPRNRGSLSKLQQCKVELTPGHYPRPGNSTSTLNSNNIRIMHSNSQCQNLEDEDLIQKVSELGMNHFVGDVKNSKKTPTKNGGKSGKRDKRQKQDENLTAMQLAILVKEKLHKESINLGVAPFTTKAGDQYLSGLATRYASELGMNEIDVLHQLDDIRHMMNTCNDVSHPSKNNYYNGVANLGDVVGKSSDLSLTSPGLPHTYANVNSPYCGTSQRTFSPGVYASSSCLSDRDEDDIYDLAAKYEGSKTFGDKHRFFGSPAAAHKLKLSPSGWYTKARKAMSKSSSTSSKCDDFSNFASSSLATHDFHIGSPTLMRTFMNGSQVGNSDSQRFSTRTRLRPGGPNHSDHRPSSVSRINQRNTFEEVGMRTLATDRSPRFPKQNGSRSANPDIDQDFDENYTPPYYNHTLFKGSIHSPMPSTPLARQRAGLSNTGSPRVQMYRTRVVYNDAKPRNGTAIGIQEASV